MHCRWIWNAAVMALALIAISIDGRGTEAAAGERRVALVIGNSNYIYAGRLANPINDASDVAASLTRLGFDVTPALNATGDVMTSTIQDFLTKARGVDVAFFYYAGHGLQYEGSPYLTPIDAKLENEFSIKHETLAAQDIVSKLEASAHTSIVVLDACRNNPLADQLLQKMAARGRSMAMARGLGRLESAAGNTLLVYSAGPDQIAEDGGGRNSPFTTAFLKHVETPGLEVEQIFKRVTAEVKAATGGKQQPERLSKLTVELLLKEGGKTGSEDASKLQAEISELRDRVSALSSPKPEPRVEPQAPPTSPRAEPRAETQGALSSPRAEPRAETQEPRSSVRRYSHSSHDRRFSAKRLKQQRKMAIRAERAARKRARRAERR